MGAVDDAHAAAADLLLETVAGDGETTLIARPRRRLPSRTAGAVLLGGGSPGLK